MNTINTTTERQAIESIFNYCLFNPIGTTTEANIKKAIRQAKADMKQEYNTLIK